MMPEALAAKSAKERVRVGAQACEHSSKPEMKARTAMTLAVNFQPASRRQNLAAETAQYPRAPMTKKWPSLSKFGIFEIRPRMPKSALALRILMTMESVRIVTNSKILSYNKCAIIARIKKNLGLL